jgi:hypothetical protein
MSQSDRFMSGGWPAVSRRFRGGVACGGCYRQARLVDPKFMGTRA